jgi:hypothetical protein
MPILLALSLLLTAPLHAQQPLVTNGGFEQWDSAANDAAGQVDGWHFGDPAVSPSGWIRNSAYPGTVLRIQDGAPEGGSYTLLRHLTERGVHLYQGIPGLEAGKWYRFSAKVRGGTLIAMAYQYYKTGPMDCATIALGRAPANSWRPVTGYYQVPAANWANSSSHWRWRRDRKCRWMT